VVTITLLCSWVLAMTMTPLLCVIFMKIKKSKKAKSEEERTNSLFYRAYRGFLLLLLRNRAATMVVTFVVFMSAMYGFGFVPQLFFPNLNSDFFYGNVTLPMGTPIERSAEIAEKVEKFVNQELRVTEERKEGITRFASFIGGNEPIFTLGYSQSRASPEVTMFMFNSTSLEITPALIDRLHEFCRDNLPDAEASFQSLSAGPPVRYPIVVRISSRDTDELFGIVDQVKKKMIQTPGTRNISDDWGQWTKKLVVKVDQDRARKAGVSSRDVAASMKSMLSGEESTQYREDDKVIPVHLRSVAADRKDLGKLESLNTYSQSGKPVPLKQVADLELMWEPSQILRRDRYRTVSLKSELTPGANAAAIIAQLRPWLDELAKDFGLGTKIELGGENEESAEANKSIGDQMPVAMLIILLLLVGQFNSLRRTAIILATILLGLIGVSVGLLVMKSYFGFMTLLGVVSLTGIVINNAIVLLDRIKIEIEEQGLDPQRAVVQAAQMRLRPILLTTATTIGGLIPLYLGGGPMWEPMAVAIMFGLLVATVLTLGVVPTLYSLFFRVRYKEFKW
jgi:multidrug efflux pump subunit AcrB